jgi:hypothetical protein
MVDSWDLLYLYRTVGVVGAAESEGKVKPFLLRMRRNVYDAVPEMVQRTEGMLRFMPKYLRQDALDSSIGLLSPLFKLVTLLVRAVELMSCSEWLRGSLRI